VSTQGANRNWSKLILAIAPGHLDRIGSRSNVRNHTVTAGAKMPPPQTTMRLQVSVACNPRHGDPRPDVAKAWPDGRRTKECSRGTSEVVLVPLLFDRLLCNDWHQLDQSFRRCAAHHHPSRRGPDRQTKPVLGVRTTHGRGQDVAEHGPPGQERLISAEETRHIDCARFIESSKRRSASVRSGGLISRDVRERVYRSRG